MRYFIQRDSNHKIIAIGTGDGGTEVTESEYNAILAEIREKAAMVDKLYSGEITIDAVPAEWREEIQSRVDTRISMEEVAAEQTVSDEEVLAVLEKYGFTE